MTNMVEIDELLREVLVHSPNAPEPIAIRYLREAAQELCERAGLWKVTDTMKVTTPECEAVLTYPDAKIHKVEWAQLNGRVLDAVTVAWLDDTEPGWQRRYNNETAQARWAVQLQPDTITVVPRETGDLDVRLVLSPSRHADTVPEFIADQYGPLLGKAAAARILILNSNEFANPQLGAALNAEWTSRLDTLVYEAQKTQLRTKPRTKPSYF